MADKKETEDTSTEPKKSTASKAKASKVKAEEAKSVDIKNAKPKTKKAAAVKAKSSTAKPAKGKAVKKPAVAKEAKAQKVDPGKTDAKRKVDKPDYIPRLKTLYSKQIAPELMKKFNLENPMLVPEITKIVLNVGDGTLHQDPKMAESIADELGVITGQKPVLTKARQSISNFKLRQGMIVGCKVTLRRKRMYEFLDRLISMAIPRVRDFRGLGDSSFDGRGSYTFGIKEQIIFPEIDYDKVVKIHGMDVTICTNAANDEQARALLLAFGFPLRSHTSEDSAAA